MAVTDLSSGDLTPALDAVQGAEDAGSIDLRAAVTSLGRAALGSGRLIRSGAGFGVEAAKALAGRSDLAPAKGDRRFADPTWVDHPGYRRVKQVYLAFSKAMDDLVSDADLEWRSKERARFAAGILTSSLAPTNTLIGNPAAIKRAMETAGGSLGTGTRHFVDDLLHNGGMPRQVDASNLIVGQNMAVTPGAVVRRTEVMELIQYTPTTPQVHAKPLVIVPPEINKYYFLDLAPGRSLVEFALSQGLQVFIISWRNPHVEHAGWDLDTYAGAVVTAIDTAREISGSDDVVTLGMCAGGITMATVLSYLAATGSEKVAAAGFGVTLIDWNIPSPVGAFQSGRLLNVARRKSRSAGVLDARSLGSVFTWMRPNDLVWNYWVNNYLMGRKPPAFDILAWNADKTNLPSALHQQFLDMFERNRLVQPGGLTVLGEPFDMSSIKMDTYVVGGLSDHLTPWQGCYRATQLVGGHSTFVLSPTGHIQTPVSPPSPKAYHFTGPQPGADPEAWRAQATRQEGTWWNHWAEWTTSRAGDLLGAPETLGSAAHPPLVAAPGTYVFEGP
ncbi:alpha/beta fold hydrolase [Sporichthya sp.]|uniref:alpha/beta fold hydrolase n=1 Tax=Sporichthya sp. TaxID=65475 RepID=UPI0017ED1EAC|nr:alpha/beta fold hydrolase [Sporichthya sp.]MBA3745278.1 alpha/beta fold hydrolase [Sporichthya sp.]